MNADDPFRPIHPGEVLREDFLLPAALSPDALADAVGLSQQCIADVLSERAPITANIALRLERALGSSAQFWMNLQSHYDLEAARAASDEAKLDSIPNINPGLAAAE